MTLADLIVGRSTSLRDALAPLDRSGLGFLMVVDEDGALAGVLTDGDIRRALLNDIAPHEPVEHVMQTDCVSLPIGAHPDEIHRALNDRILFVPLVDDERKPVDYASHRRHRRFPVAEPLLDGNEAEYLLECVRTGWISSQGPFVKSFETAVAAFHRMPFALAVSNGTSALHLALMSLGIGPGDEVIVPDLTFAATASAVVHSGATPVLVDVDRETWTLDLDAAERAATDRTRAIIPVHLYGHPCDMERLMAFARTRQLAVIEDVAEAFGARSHGKLVGTFGDAACFSFYGNKTLTTGEGGMLLLRDETFYERAALLRDHGMSPRRRYWHLEAGFNYRLTNLQAAIGVAQMERVETILRRKRALGDWYGAALSELRGVVTPPRAVWADPVCWLYTVRIDEEIGLTRSELAGRLLINGIETRPVFEPLHRMPAFERFAGDGAFPITEELSSTGLSLPSAVTLEESDVEAISAHIRAIVRVRQMHVATGGTA